MDVRDLDVGCNQWAPKCLSTCHWRSEHIARLPGLTAHTEGGGIRSLIWTIEMQSWETDCRICCLANQAPLSVRVKCERSSANANIGCHLFSWHFSLWHIPNHTSMRQSGARVIARYFSHDVCFAFVVRIICICLMCLQSWTICFDSLDSFWPCQAAFKFQDVSKNRFYHGPKIYFLLLTINLQQIH